MGVSVVMLGMIGFIVVAAILALISVIFSGRTNEGESEELLKKRFEEHGFAVRDPEDKKK